MSQALPRLTENTSIKIEKLIPGGQALGILPSGKKIFFWNALPGEIVTKYNTIKTKSNFDEAVMLSIIHPSPFRVKPKDDCFLATSPWQILDYHYELNQKQSLVVEIFKEHHISIEPPEIITDHQDYFYRNKMEYSLFYDHSDNQIHLAFHQRGSHRKIPINSSSIERPEIFATAMKIINTLNQNHEDARKYQSLLLRCNQNGEVSGGLLENYQPHPTFPNLTDQLLNHSYSYSPNGFFQINLPVYELALAEIKKHITTDQVLDLYAGVGTIGLSVARDKKLTLVEVNQYAFNELQKNAGGHFSTILAKSEDVTNYLNPSQTVILDPPRAGCDQKLLTKLLEVFPEKIIYLSCNPATQARDLETLLEKYRIKTIKTFNFFPHTPHIENLVILSK